MLFSYLLLDENEVQQNIFCFPFARFDVDVPIRGFLITWKMTTYLNDHNPVTATVMGLSPIAVKDTKYETSANSGT